MMSGRPKALLQNAGIETDVEIEVEDGQILIKAAARNPREGWEEAFRKMAEAGDDALLDGDRMGDSSWDETDWEW